MKKALLLLMLFIRIPSGHAQTESHQQVESTLYAYYRWCNNNIRDTAVLSKADTLFRLSGEKHDIRMQAVALSLKADHYYFNNNLDSLKAWIPRVQDFARKNDQIKYYYFTWSRLILYYTKQAQYTLAQYELEQYMSQAEGQLQTRNRRGIQTARTHLPHPRTQRDRRRLLPQGDGLSENNLNKFALLFSIQAGHRPHHDTGRYEEAAEELEKARRGSPCPNTSGR
ncbi:MAG: hypothetical protein ACLRM8_05005 [Alistipes sp.]